MGRQNGDAAMVNSSIALLQERFRELQRIREKRQEKEILKLFASSESDQRVASTMHFDEPTCKFTFQPDQTTLPNRPSTPQDSLLSLGLNSQSNNKHPDFRAMKSTPSSLWPNSTRNSSSSSSSSSRNLENSDVDTSLHLQIHLSFTFIIYICVCVVYVALSVATFLAVKGWESNVINVC